MNNEKGFEFKVGDIVTAFGLKGTVILNNLGPPYPIVVEYETGDLEYFYTTGHLNSWHKEPSLKLIERPKKKVKKYKVLYRDDFNNYKVTNCVYADKKEFDFYVGGYQFIQLIKESEIEVETEKE